MYICNFKAYEGEKDYVFISYAHKDSEIVYPIIERLNEEGYRVWFDDGISPGSEWPEYIANRIDHCSMVIFFTSPSFVNSENCRREVNFALSRNKNFFTITIVPTELSPGIEMQLSSQQNIMRYEYSEEEKFFQTVFAAPGLVPCKRAEGEQDDSTEKSTVAKFAEAEIANRADRNEKSQPEPSVPSTKPRKKGLIIGIAAALGAVLIACSVLWATGVFSEKEPEKEYITLNEENVFKLDTDEIYLQDMEITNSVLQEISQLKNVQVVNIEYCSFASDLDWTQYTQLSAIQQFSLYGGENPDMSFLKGMSSLDSLTISNSTITAAQIASASLTSIDLSDVSTMETVPEFGASCPALTSLLIKDSDIRGVLVDKPIQTICINNCGLIDFQLKTDVSDWKKLDVIDLSNNALTDVSFLSHCSTALRVLDLAGNPIDASSLSYIQACTTLQALDLSGIRMEDLSVISEMQFLETLVMNGCGIKELQHGSKSLHLQAVVLRDNALTSLDAMQTLLAESVEILDVSGNQCVSLEGLQNHSFEDLVLYGNGIEFTQENTADALSKISCSKCYADYVTGMEQLDFGVMDVLYLLSEATDVSAKFAGDSSIIVYSVENEKDMDSYIFRYGYDEMFDSVNAD